MAIIQLSEEQKNFINEALDGNNILVDACIGSGKTTAIQKLCDEYPTTKSILYLTYNRLLKIDAKSKIKNKNVIVQNYHGFAYKCLKEIGVNCGQPELIQRFLTDIKELPNYDVLILDEYQDIDTEISEMLNKIVSYNPTIQIIAVGDMKQKIYDRTLLDINQFINKLLKEHETLSFTKCFRLSSEIAKKLGDVWGKEINGVNDKCEVVEMEVQEIVEFIGKCEPKEILCLGSRDKINFKGKLTEVLNKVEKEFPDKYNKNTVYASIKDDDGNKLSINKNTAIFTTYDSSKGMERPYCIVFDFNVAYWKIRLKDSKYEIIRNIFCVAASRGKQKIIFCKNDEQKLTTDILKCDIGKNTEENLRLSGIKEMFDYKYVEDIEKCYSDLKVTPIEVSNHNEIIIKNKDGNIDLSPCIGEFQESIFFGKYNIDRELELLKKISNEEIDYNNLLTEQKILLKTYYDTGQDRYTNQVEIPFVTDEQAFEIKKRLSERLHPNNKTQVECKIDFSNSDKSFTVSLFGLADVVKDETVYELKFVEDLQHNHFLQCAMYMICLNLKKGILWNVKKNQIYNIEIPDKKIFLDDVARTISKHKIDAYYEPAKATSVTRRHYKKVEDNGNELLFMKHLDKISSNSENFAVIDVETNYSNEPMSVGVVISNCNFEVIDSVYFAITPEIYDGGMFSGQLRFDTIPYIKSTKKRTIEIIQLALAKYGVKYVFAYNSSFDSKCLKELNNEWCDIVSTVAYKQYNPLLNGKNEIPFSNTGRLKKYSFETVMKLTVDNNYCETHNALLDAVDELFLMCNTNMDVNCFIKNFKKDSKQRTKDYKQKKDFRIKGLPYEESYLEYRQRCLKKMNYLECVKANEALPAYNLFDKVNKDKGLSQLNAIIHNIVSNCHADGIIVDNSTIVVPIKCNSNLKFDKYCLLTEKINEFIKKQIKTNIPLNINVKLKCNYRDLDELFFRSYLDYICSEKLEYNYFEKAKFYYDLAKKILVFTTYDENEYNEFHQYCGVIERKLHDFGINVGVTLLYKHPCINKTSQTNIKKEGIIKRLLNKFINRI